MDRFLQRKGVRLQGSDFSRKGSVDQRIQDLIIHLNEQECYFTTSSCSGRIIVFSQNPTSSVRQKQGCKWLLTSHDHVTYDDVWKCLDPQEGDLTFKFEPFILHVQCRTIQDAKKMTDCAVASGFRNSGVVMGKEDRYTVAVRSTLGLEVPLSHDGKLMVTQEYINLLVDIANNKMDENWTRTKLFFDNFRKGQDPTTEKTSEEHLTTGCSNEEKE